jgi:hypothetical protein
MTCAHPQKDKQRMASRIIQRFTATSGKAGLYSCDKRHRENFAESLQVEISG